MDLNNANNWEIVYDTTLQVQVLSTNPEKYLPIPETVIPFLLDSPVIVCHTESPAPTSWRSAGFLIQKIATGLTVGAGTQTEVQEQHRALLNRFKLVSFPEISAEYSISFKPHWWFKEMKFTLWKYIGPRVSGDTLEYLARVEKKTDLILQRI